MKYSFIFASRKLFIFFYIALDLQLDDVFIRALNPEPNVAPLPVVEPPAYIHPPPPQRGRRRVRGMAQNHNNERIRAHHWRKHAIPEELRDIVGANNWLISIAAIMEFCPWKTSNKKLCLTKTIWMFYRKDMELVRKLQPQETFIYVSFATQMRLTAFYSAAIHFAPTV